METQATLKTKLDKCLQIIRKYDWLIDSYILDFYVDDHWGKLPKAWRTYFEDLPPEELCYLLNTDSTKSTTTSRVWPLSILALKQAFKELCIDRKQKCRESLPRSTLLDHPKLKHIFIKGVKPKKRHELESMASLCKHICQENPVDFVVDFGAGLGHLARNLGYAFNIKVCCLEMQTKLNAQAYEMDDNMEKLKRKYVPDIPSQKPEHVDLRLTADMSSEEFLHTIEKNMKLENDKNYTFGIIGLHPCGDLGAILMRMFLKCRQAKFLNFVGCCYMKLTSSECCNGGDYGYPLSNYLRANNSRSKLSYEAREISCHAIELYHERLSLKDYEYLKVHSFRAATERIIIKHYPELRHTRLSSVKHVPDMQFADYFYKAVKDLPCATIPLCDLNTSITQTDLLNWKNIVIFYTLRLFFAPLIESVILYDRMLFLMENDCQVQINAIFDPRLSPRNHITTALKNR
ncbi:methyltransferase-like protein 25B [Musca vetustissima]|uniref:methyltransferase-like protein 25B n=1 Tax=Musca vetustissima TaxID=27455 RepID=UPI002AB76DD6|nr:methyltransferase-like protein 25B [Musca vetustissima]